MCSTKLAFAQAPRITSYEKTGNSFTLQWTGTGANPALVQRSTSLLEGSWENVSGLSHSGSFTDWDAPGESAFYRVAMPSALTAIDQLVLSASVAIQQDLQQEIIDGSEAVGSDGDTVFYPNSPADMVPQPAAGVLENDPDFANLVKQSGISFFPGAAVFNFPATDSTSALDANGQRVNPTRWSAPMLSGRKFSASETPKWVYITPSGYQAAISAETTGRIAFNVYDVGGLLNINASGFAPGLESTAFSAEMHRKGSTLWADLRAIPGINATAFAANDAWPPQWRLPGDWGSGANGFSLFATGRKPAARFTNARAGASRFSIRSAMTPTACSPPVRNSSTMRKPLRGLSPRAAPSFPPCNTSRIGAVGTTAPPSAMTKPALIPNR